MTIYEEAVEKYGKEHQLIVTFGELSECIAEIARHMIPARVHNEQDLINEIADTCIMMEQMKVIYSDRLEQAILTKQLKLRKHLQQDLLDFTGEDHD